MATETLWLPRSSCGRACLPAQGSVPGAGPLRVAGRLLALLTILLAALVTAPVLVLASRRAGDRAGRLVARALLRSLGVRHRLVGRPPRGAALVVTNHVSWLDPLVLMAHLPVRLVAKRELRGWPVVGALATAAGTFFIDRSRPRALPGTVAQVTEALRDGRVVALFPEGTTWCGNDGGRFRPAMFQAAIDAQATVLPVTLRFRLAGGAATTVAAFVGEDSLLASVRRVLAGDGLQVNLHLHPALHPAVGASRRMLARATQASVSRIPPGTDDRTG